MSDNRYTFGVRQNLTPADLFVYIAFDETQKQLGFTDLASAAAILLRGQFKKTPKRLLTSPATC